MSVLEEGGILSGIGKNSNSAILEIKTWNHLSKAD